VTDAEPLRHGVRVANGFLSRLMGVWGARSAPSVLLMNCRCVHSFGLRRPLVLIFLDREFRVVSIQDHFRPWRVAWDWRACHVLETWDSTTLAVGELLPEFLKAGAPSTGACRPSGASLVEGLLALPIVVFTAFVVIQIGLLWHAKYAITHAAHVAARHASVHHGSDAAIRDGLVVGLMPLVGRSKELGGVSTALFQSAAEVTQGLAMGWIRWQVISPTRQSFLDWGVPGDPVLSPGSAAHEREIPSVALMGLSQRRIPRSGIASTVSGLPVGVASGQTLLEANHLKINLRVGIPLQMPLVGKLLGRSLAWWSGCGWSMAPPSDRVGLLDFGVGAQASPFAASIECRALAARDASGTWRPRWPVETAVVIQMQSNARQSLMVLGDRSSGK